MLLKGWFITWISLSFVLVGTKSSRPRFDTSTDMGMVLVPSDAEVDSVIFRLRATDQDVDFPLVFDITSTVSPVVRIENLPCTLYNKVCQANVILTRRLTAGRLHDFAVRVRDSKGDSNSMQATISVTNATTPRDTIFPHIPTLIMVPEDTKPGKELDYILVKSNPWSGKPVYIELWQPKELFTIRQRLIPGHTRGTIILTGELDFETQSMYTLTIYATDPYTEPKKDTRNIAGLHLIVIVQDVQDVPPIFTLAPPLTKINNTVHPGDVILRVHAEDGDKGVPREITYGLVSEGNPFTPFFNITESTGEIILARPLEELTQITHVGAPIVLSVVAEEIRRSTDEPPAQATVVKVGLLLGEPGNNPPYFENDNYVAWMDENAEPGTSIVFEDPYSTKVRDEDIGKAGVFTLQLENNNGTFEISPTVAERTANFILTVRDNSLIDYEIYKSLRFKIVAQEVGPATNLSASVPVTIFLRDKNDNPPEFQDTSYEVTLSENVTAGTRVIQVHATDKDTGLFGKIQYTRIIGPGSEAFVIQPDTGVITVNMDTSFLDREITPQLQLTVEACDEDGKGLRGTVPFVVNLLDANDNAPVFEKDVYEFMLNLDLTNFTIPAIIKAFDADAEPPNNVVRYEIIHGNYDNKFILNDITGEILVREPITKPRNTRHNSYQRFATKHRKNFISSSDSPENLLSSTQKSFDISTVLSILHDNNVAKNNTGIIKRRKREDKDTLFTLTVRAYDLGVPHLSGTTQVKILQSPQAGVRTLMFLVPGEHPDRIHTAQTLTTITGGKVTVLEIRPYTPGSLPNGVKDLPSSGTGKRSIVVAKVEYIGSESSVVDIDKIRAALAANGVGVIGGDMSPDGSTEIKPSGHDGTIINKNDTFIPVNGGVINNKTTIITTANGGTTVNKNSTFTTINREEVIVYKAENQLLFWLLIILGLLVLAAIIMLIVCCICPTCPFYMAPRKRRIHSSDTLLTRGDGRPKRHMYRKYPQVEATWSEKRQAWSADHNRDNWQFNRRNTKNFGIASLPGDIIYDDRDRDRELPRKAHSLRLQNAAGSIHILETRKRDQDHLYVEDVEGFRVKGYDVPDIDSLRQNEIERGSNVTREAYMRDVREKDQQTMRDQQFYRSGNAEVMRLITRGAVEGNITYRQPEIIIDQVHRVDGKDILLRRFIEDQNLRVNQDYHDSMQDLEKQSMESHKRQKETSMQQQQQQQQQHPEIILIPEQLEQTHRKHIEELGPDVERLIIDHGHYDKSTRSEMKENQDAATGTTVIIQGAIPKASELSEEQNIPKYPVNVQHYSIHDLELARQNALLTRLLLERDRGISGAMIDTGSYLETQSLPGQVAAGTQTNQTIATQTEQQSRSRSDNEESEEDARIRRKMRSKKRHDGETKRVRALWMRSPIREEDREYSEKDTNFIRRKIKDIKDARKSTIEPDVLKEISDSLDETGDRETPLNNRESFGDSSNSRYESRDEIPQRDDSSSIEMSKDEYTRAHGRRVDDRNETRKKEKEVTGKEETQEVKKPSFKILEREISSLSRKLSKLAGKNIKSKQDFHKSDKLLTTSSRNKDIDVTSPDISNEDDKKMKKADTVRSQKSKSSQRVTKLSTTHLKKPVETSDKYEKQQKSKYKKKPLASTPSSVLEEIDRLKKQAATKDSEDETSKYSVAKIMKAKLKRQLAIKESSVEKQKDVLIKQSKKSDNKAKKSDNKCKSIKEDHNVKKKSKTEMLEKYIEESKSKESSDNNQRLKTKSSSKQENSSTDESQMTKDSRYSDSKIFSDKISTTSPSESLKSPEVIEKKTSKVNVESIIPDDNEENSLIKQVVINSSTEKIQLTQVKDDEVVKKVDKMSQIAIESAVDSKKKLDELSGKDQAETLELKITEKRSEDLKKIELTPKMLPESFSESSIGKHKEKIEESASPSPSLLQTISKSIKDNIEKMEAQATELIQSGADNIKESIRKSSDKVDSENNEQKNEIIDSTKIISAEQKKTQEIEGMIVETFESEQKELAVSNVHTEKVSGINDVDDVNDEKDQRTDLKIETEIESLPVIPSTLETSASIIDADVLKQSSLASRDDASESLSKVDPSKQIKAKCEEKSENFLSSVVSSSISDISQSSQVIEEQKEQIDDYIDDSHTERLVLEEGTVNLFETDMKEHEKTSVKDEVISDQDKKLKENIEQKLEKPVEMGLDQITETEISSEDKEKSLKQKIGEFAEMSTDKNVEIKPLKEDTEKELRRDSEKHSEIIMDENEKTPMLEQDTEKKLKEDLESTKHTEVNIDVNMKKKVLEKDTEKDSEQVPEKDSTKKTEHLVTETKTDSVKVLEESLAENAEKEMVKEQLGLVLEPTSPVSQASSLSPKQIVISRETSFLSSPKKISIDKSTLLTQEVKPDFDHEADSKLEIHISEDKGELIDKKIEIFIDKPKVTENIAIQETLTEPSLPVVENVEEHSLADTIDTLDDDSDVSSESSTQTAFIARPYGTPRHRRLIRMEHVSPTMSPEKSPEKHTEGIKNVETDESLQLTMTEDNKHVNEESLHMTKELQHVTEEFTHVTEELQHAIEEPKRVDDLITDDTKNFDKIDAEGTDNEGISQVDRKLETSLEVESSQVQDLDSLTSTVKEPILSRIESVKDVSDDTNHPNVIQPIVRSDLNTDDDQKEQQKKKVESIYQNKQEKVVDVDDSTSFTDHLGTVNNLRKDRKKSGEQKIVDSKELLTVTQSSNSLSRDSSKEKLSKSQDVSKDKLKSMDKSTDKKIQQKLSIKTDPVKEKKQNPPSKDQVNLPKKFVGKVTRPSKISDSDSEQSKEKVGFDRTKSRKELDHKKIIPEKLKDGKSVIQKMKKQEISKDENVDLNTEDTKKKVKKLEEKVSKFDIIKLPLNSTKDKEELALKKPLQEKIVDTEPTISVSADMKEVRPLVSDTTQVDKEIRIKVEGEHTKADGTHKCSRKTERIIIVEISNLKNKEDKVQKIMEEKITETFSSSVTVEKSNFQHQSIGDEKTPQTFKLIQDEKLKGMHDTSPSLPKIIRHIKEEPYEAQPRYMEWYKQNREEIERRRQEKKEGEEEQPPKWLRKSTRQRWLKMTPEDRKLFELKTPEVTPQKRKRIKPLINVESEQLKAIVRQGRKLRKAEGGNDDPSIEIYAPEKPPTSLPSQSSYRHHYRTQHSEYKYEKLPPPFYLHPPPAPQSTPQASPRTFEAPPTSSSELTQEQVTSPIIIPLQGGNRLRHQQLLEKKSVFDIAYSEAAPSQLRADSTTPPT